MASEKKAMRNWKEYRNESARSTTGLYVSVNERGIIVLNRKAYAVLGEPEAVSLLYDEEHATIGLRPERPFLPTSFPVKERGVSGNMLIRALPFMKSNRIGVGYTIRFLNPVMEDDVLILDLSLSARATQTPRTGWRKRQKAAE